MNSTFNYEEKQVVKVQTMGIQLLYGEIITVKHNIELSGEHGNKANFTYGSGVGHKLIGVSIHLSVGSLKI